MADIFQDHRQLKHEEMRKKLWADVCASVAGAFNCKRVDVAIDRADGALEAFDKRFPSPKSAPETYQHPLAD